MEPPQVPLATKVNGRLTAAPPAVKTPKVWGALGERTPLVASNVTTRFVVLTPPMLANPNDMVTSSPGSMALFVGMQPSAVSTAELETTLGTGATFTTTVKELVT